MNITEDVVLLYRLL